MSGWILFAVYVAGGILAGAGAYRLVLTADGKDTEGAFAVALMSLFFAPLALPIVAMFWLAMWPQIRAHKQEQARKTLAELEREVFGK